MIIAPRRSQPAGGVPAREAEREPSPVSTLANLLSQRTRRAFTQPPPVPLTTSADTGAVVSGDAAGARTDARAKAAAGPAADREGPSHDPNEDEAGQDALAEGLSAAAMAMRHPEEDATAGVPPGAHGARMSNPGAPTPVAPNPVAAGAGAISAGEALDRMVHRFFDDIATLEQDFRQSFSGAHAPGNHRRQ